jgi:predicted small secreted protein
MREDLSIVLTILALFAATPLLGAGEDISAGGHAPTNSGERRAP